MANSIIKYSVIVLIYIFCNNLVNAQDKTYRVFFKDKGPYSFYEGSPLYQKTLDLLSDKAKTRRKKVFPENELISFQDAPLYAPYIDSIKKIGCNVLLNLRYRNYSVVRCNEEEVLLIRALQFVDSVRETTSILFPQKTEREVNVNIIDPYPISDIFLNNCGAFDYGKSFTQINSLGATKIHELGITGEGVLLGIIDNGFRWRNNFALASSRVIADYDFINLDSISSNEPVDRHNQDWHGTSVMSIISSYYPGKLIGISPNVDLILAKTEDMNSETRIEEDNLSAALEWFELLGVDIANISLGYGAYDSTEVQYQRSDFNGRKTIAAVAVNEAVRRGICVFTSAGNNGPSKYTINTPSDADSAITVAAMNIDSVISVARFSSRGPRSDGGQKPNIAAMGAGLVGVDLFHPEGLSYMFGTSYASPLSAGAGALILSAFPELSPSQLRTLIYNAGTESEPNDSVGWGIPDYFKAMTNYGIVISPPAYFVIGNYLRIACFLKGKSVNPTAKAFLKFYGRNDFNSYDFIRFANTDIFVADIPLDLFNAKNASLHIIADDFNSRRRKPFPNDEYFMVNPNLTKIPCGIDPKLLPKAEPRANKAYLEPSVITAGFGSTEIIAPIWERTAITVELFNSIGQKLYSEKYAERNSGVAHLILPTSNFASGSYYIRVTHSGKTDILTLVIAR